MTAWTVAILWTAAMALLMVGSGLLVGSVARRAVDGRMGPNPVAGIRTSATTASPAAWVAAHEAGLGPTLRGAWVMGLSGPLGIIVGAIAALVVADAVEGYEIAFVVVLLAAMTLGTALVVQGAVRGHRAAKRVLGEER